MRIPFLLFGVHQPGNRNRFPGNRVGFLHLLLAFFHALQEHAGQPFFQAIHLAHLQAQQATGQLMLLLERLEFFLLTKDLTAFRQTNGALAFPFLITNGCFQYGSVQHVLQTRKEIHIFFGIEFRTVDMQCVYMFGVGGIHSDGHGSRRKQLFQFHHKTADESHALTCGYGLAIEFPHGLVELVHEKLFGHQTFVTALPPGNERWIFLFVDGQDIGRTIADNATSGFQRFLQGTNLRGHFRRSRHYVSLQFHQLFAGCLRSGLRAIHLFPVAVFEMLQTLYAGTQRNFQHEHFVTGRLRLDRGRIEGLGIGIGYAVALAVVITHLIDELLLGFQNLPQPRVTGVFRDKIANGHPKVFSIFLQQQVALADDAANTLFHIGRTIRRIDLPHGNQPVLDVHARSHLGRRTDHDPHLARPDRVEQFLFLLIRIGIVDEGDLLARDAQGHHPVAQFFIGDKGCWYIFSAKPLGSGFLNLVLRVLFQQLFQRAFRSLLFLVCGVWRFSGHDFRQLLFQRVLFLPIALAGRGEIEIHQLRTPILIPFVIYALDVLRADAQLSGFLAFFRHIGRIEGPRIQTGLAQIVDDHQYVVLTRSRTCGQVVQPPQNTAFGVFRLAGILPITHFLTDDPALRGRHGTDHDFRLSSLDFRHGNRVLPLFFQQLRNVFLVNDIGIVAVHAHQFRQIVEGGQGAQILETAREGKGEFLLDLGKQTDPGVKGVDAFFFQLFRGHVFL